MQRLLSKRFGSIPAEISARIAGASSAEIEVWLDRVLDARSLEDLFGPITH